MIRPVTLATLLLLSGFAPGASAADDVYPPSYSIYSSYIVDPGHVAVADTFHVRRTLVNAESFTLGGLYFSDNLPPEFMITDQILTVNGAPTPVLTIGPISGQIAPGYDVYHWIVDSHGGQAGYDYIVAPGDTVGLKLDLVCNQPGQYYLPTHSTVFLGVDTGFFATSAPVVVTVMDPVTVPDDQGQRQPGAIFASTAHPNPFNSRVTIEYSGNGICGTRAVFSVFDPTGRVLEQVELPAESITGRIDWLPDATLGSGIYFYRIVRGNEATGGKLLLIR